MISLLDSENEVWVDLRYLFNGGDLYVNIISTTGVEVDSLLCTYRTVSNYTAIDVSAFNLAGGQYVLEIAEDVKTNVVYSEMLLVERNELAEAAHSITITSEKYHRIGS